MLKKYPKIKKCHLYITSHVGISAGAIHSYGSLRCDDREIKLKCILTAETAKRLSTRDYRYRAGAMSERFESEIDIRKGALKIWKKRFPDAVILLEGSSSCASVQRCLSGPKELKNKINSLWRQAEKIGWYEGNEELMTEIDDNYMDLLRKWDKK